MESYLFSFQMMHKSQFQKIDPYDWFCGPGSHIVICKQYALNPAETQLFVNPTVTCS